MKNLNFKPIRKVRYVSLDIKTVAEKKQSVFKDIDDFIFGDKRTIPSER